MHPIEHLRHVARARGVDPTVLVAETAEAMTAMRMDPAGVVVACRRIVERHPDCGPLWWFASRLLAAADPRQSAREAVIEIERDPTPRRLADALPDESTVVMIGEGPAAVEGLVRRGDVRVLVVDSHHSATSVIRRLERSEVICEPVAPEGLGQAIATAAVVIVEARAVSPVRLIAAAGSLAAAAVAARVGVPLWVVAGVGRRVPDEYLTVMTERLCTEGEPWELDHDVVPVDLVTAMVTADGLQRGPEAVAPTCPFMPELLRTSPM